MSIGTDPRWSLSGWELTGCNCDWGCPCQFMAKPTRGSCEGTAGFLIERGHFEGVPLDGVRFAHLLAWPGAVHQGGGIFQLIVDPAVSPAQREIIEALSFGREGGICFEVYASTCSLFLDTLVRPVTLEIDIAARRGLLRVPGLVENRIEPIRNPVTGEEHQARIVLPGGFEFTEAEMGDSVELAVESGPLSFRYEHVYGQLNRFDWHG